MSSEAMAWAKRCGEVGSVPQLVLMLMADWADHENKAWPGVKAPAWRQVALPPGHRKRCRACPARSVGGAQGVGQVRDVPALTAPTWPRWSGRDDSSVDEPQVVHGFVDGFEGEVPVAGLGNLRQLPCGPIELLLCDVVVGSIDGESPVALRLNEPFAGGIHADDLLLVVLHLVCRRLAPPQYHRKPARARLSGACVGPRGGEQ